jgi:hypothetical protein
LKGIVPNKYKNNPALLAEWHTARHIERPAQKANAPAPATTTKP